MADVLARPRIDTMMVLGMSRSSSPQAWSIIARLTSEHMESWEEEKQLRSGRHSDLDIYAKKRLSGNVEQPHRHRVRNILRRVLDFRQLQQPRINLLLRLPWLSHPHYQRSTREVLRRLVLDHRNWALPFHLPSTKLAETPHPRVHTVMWNFSSFQGVFERHSMEVPTIDCAAPSAQTEEKALAEPGPGLLCKEPGGRVGGGDALVSPINFGPIKRRLINADQVIKACS